MKRMSPNRRSECENSVVQRLDQLEKRMKIPLTVLLFLLIALISVAKVRAENIDVFVMAGQSNMQGWQGNGESYPPDPNGIDKQVRFWWETPTISNSGGKWVSLQPQGGRFPEGHFGPEVTFARLLAENGHNLAVFKYSLGSTGLAYVWKEPGHNGMYDQMIAELRKAMALLGSQGIKIKIKALVWIQGESDAESEELAEGYGDRLKSLIHHFRTTVANDEELPIILGLDEQHAWVREFPKVLEAQQRLAREDPNIIFTSMIGLEKADDAHLSPKSLEEHGARLFAAYQELTVKAQPMAESNSLRPPP